jgi:hypothetical protein
MLGQQPPCGTGDSRILIDEAHMMELFKSMGDTKVGKNDKLNVIPEDKEDAAAAAAEDKDELYTNDDLQIIIRQKEVKRSKCYKLPQQKVVIK